MPATVTHAFFAEDIYDKLDYKYKEIIKNDKMSFLMFSQSMDSMMFYNLLNLKTEKTLKNFSHTFHTKNVNKYFYNLIHYIKSKHYYNDSQTLAYLYGHICHYCLDTTIHPFIFYKTGLFNKKDKSTFKYNALHNYIETFIDNTMLTKRGYSLKKFNFKNFCFDHKPFSNELKDTINYSFYKTYHISNMGNIYYKSLKQMDYCLQLFRIDHYGIKKAIYKFCEIFTPKKFMKFSCISYYNVLDHNDYLNNKKKNWCYPVNTSIKSNKSFFELYDSALDNALEIIKQVNMYFFNNKAIDTDSLFLNKNYLTGIDCNSKLKQKYFEF